MNELRTLEEIETALRTHDWFYDYSDDHSVWTKGNDQRKRIADALRTLPIEQARELWDRWAPKGFRFPIQAVFRYWWSDLGEGVAPVPFYGMPMPDGKLSDVGADTLRAHGFEIPYTQDYLTWKAQSEKTKK